METTYTHGKKTLDFINKQMDKKGLNNLLSQMYLEFGGAKTAELANSQNPVLQFQLQICRYLKLKKNCCKMLKKKSKNQQTDI